MKQITIKNDSISLTTLDYGAIIQKIELKNSAGELINVVVGHTVPEQYLDDPSYLGACVGRYAGRISQEGFTLQKKRYMLHTENGVHLHGGKEGFSKKYWTIEEVHHGENPFIKLSYLSKDLEEGYPGNLQVQITYQLIKSALHITHKATTDKTTVVNLTNHSYFKLDDEASVVDYKLLLDCDQRLEMDANLIPTGKTSPVKETLYDFRIEKRIGNTLLDTPFIISNKAVNAVQVSSQKSGIRMEVSTNQPAVVVYTPKDFHGICFETQNHPDAPNIDSFPSSVLRPGETYNNTAIFKFGFVL